MIQRNRAIAVALCVALLAIDLPDAAVAAADCVGCTCFLGVFCGQGQVWMPEQCIEHNGVRRCFMIHKPIGTPNNAPLVVDMHGYSVHVYTNIVSGVAHGGGHYDFSRWKTIANREKFIVVRCAVGGLCLI